MTRRDLGSWGTCTYSFYHVLHINLYCIWHLLPITYQLLDEGWEIGLLSTRDCYSDSRRDLMRESCLDCLMDLIKGWRLEVGLLAGFDEGLELGLRLGGSWGKCNCVILIFITNITYAYTYLIICVTASSSLRWSTHYHIHRWITNVGVRFVAVGGEGTLIMLLTQHSFLLYYWLLIWY